MTPLRKRRIVARIAKTVVVAYHLIIDPVKNKRKEDVSIEVMAIMIRQFGDTLQYRTHIKLDRGTGADLVYNPKFVYGARAYEVCCGHCNHTEWWVLDFNQHIE